MKNILILLAGFMALSFTTWEPDFNEAKLQAKARHKLILLNFSGSDWCGPCIRMKQDVFGNENFSNMADKELVLVNADFPRKKKNQLTKERQEQNEALAEQYNPSGKFPYTLLLDENGKVLRSWEGFPEESVINFTRRIKTLADAYHHSGK